jgi:hypothetical protein
MPPSLPVLRKGSLFYPVGSFLPIDTLKPGSDAAESLPGEVTGSICMAGDHFNGKADWSILEKRR